MDTLYTVKSAASIMGYHPQTVYQFLRDGVLESFKPRGHWRISEAHLVAFLASRSR